MGARIGPKPVQKSVQKSTRFLMRFGIDFHASCAKMELKFNEIGSQMRPGNEKAGSTILLVFAMKITDF